jgi:hypothetical protein
MLRRTLAAACCLLIIQPLQAQTTSELLYVLNSITPSVSVISPSEGKVLHEIAIADNPTQGLLDPSGKYLYVLHNGLFDALGKVQQADKNPRYRRGSLEVIDLEARKVEETIGLGWNSRAMWLDSSNRHLFILSEGWGYNEKAEDPAGFITVISLDTRKPIQRLTNGRLIKAAISTENNGFLVLSGGAIYLKNPKASRAHFPPLTDARLTVFDANDFHRLGETILDGTPEQLLPAGPQHAFVIDGGQFNGYVGKGKYNRPGSVKLLDIERLAITGTCPLGFGAFVAALNPADRSISVVSSSGLGFKRPKLYLKELRQGEARTIGSEPGPGYLSLPGPHSPQPQMQTEILTMPTAKRAYLLSRSDLVPVNLETPKIESRIIIGNKEVRGEKRVGMAVMGAFIFLFPVALAVMIIGYAVSGHSGTPPILSLATSQDERFVYAKDSFTDEITALRASDGQIEAHLPSGPSCYRIFLAPGGKFLFAQNARQVSWFNTSTNTKAGEYVLKSGGVWGAFPDYSRERVLILTDDSVVAWDAQTGEVRFEVKGVRKPIQVLFSLTKRQTDSTGGGPPRKWALRP